MTKLTTTTELLNSDWIDALEGLTVPEAIQWLQDFYAPSYILDVEYYGYDGGKSGVITTERLETDEEEAEREARTERLVRENEERINYEKRRQAIQIERATHEDVALHAYLTIHKNNPKIGDLENLYRALQGLERDGVAPAHTSINTIKDCMRRLENGQ